MAAKKPDLPVLPGETDWTTAEVAYVRAELLDWIAEMREELAEVESGLEELFVKGGDNNGRDAADVGTNNFERDQELSLVQTHRDQLEQAELALGRFESGLYGICEICGEAIGKGRLMAFPRATMCVNCKSRIERRA